MALWVFTTPEQSTKREDNVALTTTDKTQNPELMKTMWHYIIIQSNPAMETSYLTRTGHQVGRVSAVGLRHTDTISDGIPTFQVSQGNQAVLGCWLWQCRQRPDIVVECCPDYWDSHSTLKKKKKRHCCLRLGYVSATFSRFCVLLSSSEHTLLVPFWM